jgi:S1-C subfamily serine protease
MGTFSRLTAAVVTMASMAGISAVIGYHLGRPAQVSTERMLDSSVSIKTISHVRTDRFGDSVWEPAFGSGFLISAAPCEVWTNHHVVKDAALIRIIPRGMEIGNSIPAHVIHMTPRPDIAVLRLDSCEGIRVAMLGDSSYVEVGMEAYAVGNPLGNNPDSISRGIVSHGARHVRTNTYLQTDASINPGNSGGALFDHDGYVIGMNVSLVSTKKGGGNTGIGYAIPVNRVKSAVERLRSHAPGWGTAGIAEIASNLTAAEAAVFNVPNKQSAVILTETPEGEPGAGFLNERDVIYQVDGVVVNDVQHLRRIFAEREPGTEVTLDLVRGGERRRATLKLRDGYERGKTPGAQPYLGLLGMTLEMWSNREGEEGRFATPVITRVQSLGPAHLAEISSSQHSMGFSGAKFVEFLLDVKTVTGVVLDGNYYLASDVASVHDFAADAYSRGVPLLLEIEHWARRDPRNARTELVHRKTAFFKVEPTPGTASVVPAGQDADLEAVAADLPPHRQRTGSPV